MQISCADQPEPCKKCSYANNNCMLQPGKADLKSVNVAELVLFQPVHGTHTYATPYHLQAYSFVAPCAMADATGYGSPAKNAANELLSVRGCALPNATRASAAARPMQCTAPCASASSRSTPPAASWPGSAARSAAASTSGAPEKVPYWGPRGKMFDVVLDEHG